MILWLERVCGLQKLCCSFPIDLSIARLSANSSRAVSCRIPNSECRLVKLCLRRKRNFLFSPNEIWSGRFIEPCLPAQLWFLFLQSSSKWLLEIKCIKSRLSCLLSCPLERWGTSSPLYKTTSPQKAGCLAKREGGSKWQSVPLWGAPYRTALLQLFSSAVFLAEQVLMCHACELHPRSKTTECCQLSGSVLSAHSYFGFASLAVIPWQTLGCNSLDLYLQRPNAFVCSVLLMHVTLFPSLLSASFIDKDW